MPKKHETADEKYKRLSRKYQNEGRSDWDGRAFDEAYGPSEAAGRMRQSQTGAKAPRGKITTPVWTGPPLFCSVDPFRLACNITADGAEYWPRLYDLTKGEWRTFERKRAAWSKILRTAARGGALPDLSNHHPVSLYPRELVRLAFLPAGMRTEILDYIVTLTKHAMRAGHIPKPAGGTVGRRQLSVVDDESVKKLYHVARLFREGLGIRGTARRLNLTLDEVRRLRDHVKRLGPPEPSDGHLLLSVKRLRREVEAIKRAPRSSK